MAFKKWLTISAGLVLLAILLPASASSADTVATVSISAPANIPVGGSFTARINVSQATAFVSYQIQLNFDKTVIQVQGPEGGAQGVTAGLFGTSVLPVDMWSFNPPGAAVGSIRIVGRGPGNDSVGGTGYLAEVHFNVVGTIIGQQTDITPTETDTFQNGIFDNTGAKLTTAQPWVAYNVQVYLPLQISTAVLPDGAAGYTYSPGSSVNMVAIGGSPPYTWNAHNLPEGLLFSSGGTLSGAPSGSASGNYSVAVHVDDTGGGSVDKSLNLQIYPLLQVTTATLPNATKGIDYSLNNFTMSATGGKPGYTWNSTNLPAGLGIAGNGTLSGIPTVSGDFNPVAITVTDSFNPAHTMTRSFSLHIGGVVQITSLSLPDASVGSSYSTTLAANGGTQPYTWSATGLPDGLHLDAVTGVISGTPTTAGNSSVSLSVTDSASPHNSGTQGAFLTVYAALTITTNILPRSGVETGNNLPAAPGWVTGVPYSGNLTATGGKGPYHWTATGLPSGITLSDSGAFGGSTTAFGLFNTITITVTDSASPAKSTSKTALSLKIYKPGDAGGDDSVTIADVTYVERVILGLSAPTAGCDANLNGSITVADVTKIERIILGYLT